MLSISVQRLEQIEIQRNEVYSTKEYQQWMKELNVSRMYVDNQPIQRANDIMSLWDEDRFSRSCKERGWLYRLTKRINP
jgi:hypothetical protein